MMLKNILGTSGARILNALASLLILWIATNQLGREAWGTAGLILLDISLILLIVELFAGSALVYFTPRKSARNLLLIAYIWTAIVLVFFSLAFGLLSLFPQVYELVVPKGYGIHILLLVALNSLHGVNLNLLLGKKRISAYNKLFVTQFCVLLVTFSIMVWALEIKDERAFVYALYVSYGLPVLFGWLLVLPYITSVHNSKGQISLRELFTYGLIGQLASITHLINKRLSYYFIRIYAGLSPLGVYAAGIQLTEGLRLIGQSISLVQFSSISNSNDPGYARLISLQLLKFSVVLTSMALVVLISIPRHVFELVFSNAFGDIKLVIISLAPGVIALSANTIFSHYFSGTGRPKYNLYAALIGLIVTIPALFILIPAYGFIGAGISASLAYAAAVVYQWFVFRHLTGSRATELLPSISDFKLMANAFKALFKS